MGHPRKFLPAKCSKMGRPRKFFPENYLFIFHIFREDGGGGGGGGDFSSIFSSRVKKIEKLLINCIFNIKSNKKVNSVFFSGLIVENPVKVYLREFSKIHYPRKFLPAKYPKIVRTRKFLPAKCKNFAVGPNRESFFPRKFLPLK